VARLRRIASETVAEHVGMRLRTLAP
jgi:hypothetical protein